MTNIELQTLSAIKSAAVKYTSESKTDKQRNNRLDIATQAMCALISNKAIKYENKKHLVDNAIAYADMLLRRINEIPDDAQQRSENGMSNDK